MNEHRARSAIQPVVALEEVSKVYGQVRAVAGLSMELHRAPGGAARCCSPAS